MVVTEVINRAKEELGKAKDYAKLAALRKLHPAFDPIHLQAMHRLVWRARPHDSLTVRELVAVAETFRGFGKFKEKAESEPNMLHHFARKKTDTDAVTERLLGPLKTTRVIKVEKTGENYLDWTVHVNLSNISHVRRIFADMRK